MLIKLSYRPKPCRSGTLPDRRRSAVLPDVAAHVSARTPPDAAESGPPPPSGAVCPPTTRVGDAHGREGDDEADDEGGTRRVAC